MAVKDAAHSLRSLLGCTESIYIWATQPTKPHKSSFIMIFDMYKISLREFAVEYIMGFCKSASLKTVIFSALS